MTRSQRRGLLLLLLLCVATLVLSLWNSRHIDTRIPDKPVPVVLGYPEPADTSASAPSRSHKSEKSRKAASAKEKNKSKKQKTSGKKGKKESRHSEGYDDNTGGRYLDEL